MEHKTIDGKEYVCNGKNLTKAEAVRKAKHMRLGQFSARIIKVSRGNYEVWSR